MTETTKPRPVLRLPVILEPRRDNWGWKTDDCPFCAQPHRHGGGPVSGDPREYLSGRAAHCTVSRREGVPVFYVLVDADPAGTLKKIAARKA